MNLYDVTVAYTIKAGDTVTNASIVIRRSANKASDAISIISSLFGSLSNYTDDHGNKYLTIRSVTATEI